MGLWRNNKMKKCNYCNSEVEDSAKYCPHCGNGNCFTNSGDEKSIGLTILSFFIPLIGLIFFCIWEKDFPLRAKSCGKGALFGVITGAILSALLFVLYFIFIFSLSF